MKTGFFDHFELSFQPKTEFYAHFWELSFPKIGTEFFDFAHKKSLKPTLRQCHETPQIFMGNERILRVAKRWCHFLQVCFGGKMALFWLFRRAALVSFLAPQKAIPKSQKDFFLENKPFK